MMSNDHDTNRRQFIPVPGTHVFVTAANRDLFDDTAATTPASDSVPGLANALRPTPDPLAIMARTSLSKPIPMVRHKFTSD